MCDEYNKKKKRKIKLLLLLNGWLWLSTGAQWFCGEHTDFEIV